MGTGVLMRWESSASLMVACLAACPIHLAYRCIDIMTAVGSYMVRPRFYTAELWEGLYVHGRDTEKVSI